MIQNIEISKLHNHPKNPRRDLGDLTELADSIKAQGVLQNLTVVPWFSTITGAGADDPKQQEEMGFYVVIGNRRLAASKLAGLTELPCVVSDMDYKTQLGTMLLENMQRVDLTVYEQAQGFQMMLDLGETIVNISEKTGFSESTVRRRMKLLELDKDKFKESAERGANLMDYAELEKIEDITLRNSVLDKIGTQNFKYELQRAIDKEKKDKATALLIEQLNSFATQVENSNGLRWIKSYYGSDNDKVEKPEDADTAKYFYVVSSYGHITLYCEAAEIEEDIAAKEQREKQKVRQAALEEITKRAYELRQDFIRNLSNAKAKKNIGIIIESALYAMVDTYQNAEYDDIAEFFDIKPSDEDEWNFNDFVEHIRQQPELYLLVATYCALDSDRERYFNWNSKHQSNEELDRVYNLLEKLGYEMSDEELALRNGTHELFECDDEDNQ